MFTHDMKNRVYIGPDISKQPTLTCVQTEIRLSLLGGTAEMSAVSFFVYEPVTWLLTNRGSPDKPGGLSIQLCKSEKKEFYIRYSS